MVEAARKLTGNLWLLLCLLAVLASTFIIVFHDQVGLAGRVVLSAAQATVDRNQILADSQGDFTNIFFLHHSVGHNLIRQGGLRECFTAAGFAFYDQGYNYLGLTRPDGTSAGYSYYVPGDNTDPDGLLRIFQQANCRLPLNTLSGLLQHEIVLLKSCYTAIWDLNEAGLEEQRNEYLKIRERMALHPNKLFVILTSPPANPAETSPQAAANSKRLAEWLSSSNFTEESPNVYVFDLFSLLAVKDQTSTECSMLRPDYRNGKDSHPNQLANQVIVPLLVKFVREAVKSYRQRQNVSS